MVEPLVWENFDETIDLAFAHLGDLDWRCACASFELHGGMTLEGLNAKPVESSFLGFTIDPPEPNEMFDYYLGVASKAGGLCIVTAMRTKQQHGDISIAFNKLGALIQRKYGSAERKSDGSLAFLENLPDGLASVVLDQTPARLGVSYYFSGFKQCIAADIGNYGSGL